MGKNNNYTPQPVDTTDPDELLALGETIAKNVHEVWAEGRIKDGWTYGTERNDTLRQTSGLTTMKVQRYSFPVP